MTFDNYLEQKNIDKLLKLSEKSFESVTDNTIADILQKEHIDIEDFILLLSAKAGEYLKDIAYKSRNLTIKRFGKVINFYVPLYLSNECDNCCTYCGYNANIKQPRITLSFDEIRAEMEKIKSIGFDNILLLTGESKSKIGLDYLSKAVEIAKEYFTYVGLEIYPLSIEEYRVLVDAGASGLTIYQETYNREIYDKIHLAGKKKDYNYRIETPDRALSGGFRKIGIGALLGLYDWRYEAIYIALHIDYLKKKFWRQEVTLSFPRINPISKDFNLPYRVSDKNFIHMITVMRLYLEDVPFVLSTRESPNLRDKVIELAITQISAGSRTTPGGYQNIKIDNGQFDVCDTRELDEMIEIIKKTGYDPVIKDWDKNFAGVVD